MDDQGLIPGQGAAPAEAGAGEPPIPDAVAEPAAEAAPVLPATYAPARASHAEVLASRDLFMATLKEALAVFGIQMDKPPRMASRLLDLQQLYRNVTSLGGCAKVTAEKKWREAGGSFHFPGTITSVSYTLRHKYQQFLWDYEQMYFWRNTGERVPVPPTAAATRGEPNEGRKRPRLPDQPDGEMTTFLGLPARTPIQLTAMSVTGGGPEMVCVGSRGTITLDARFDVGYFVSVRVVGQEFCGVLYYPPPAHSQPVAMTPGGVQDLCYGGPLVSGAAAVPAPRAAMQPFDFFNAEARQKLRTLQPHLTLAETTRRVSELWTQATEVETAPYEALANIDRVRYQSELEAYNYRLATEASLQQAAEAAAQVAAASAATAQAQNPIYLRPAPAAAAANGGPLPPPPPAQMQVVT
ncbi:hypothetical protein WJX81_000532 [Elliptochloris bilobata]|uniref:ARID domain-containing protein n=1 Tax=Elliptochloris bilobata TaxID=381761 RepID=A0AAW1S3X4_9CHLO